MTMFTCGPVQMYPHTLNIRNKGFTYFRTKEYGNVVKLTLEKLSRLIGNNEENATIYLATSGTGAMEATVENCITDNDKSLVINGGSFGKRFCELLKYHNKTFSSIDLKWNEELTQEHLKPYENKGYATLFVNIHETATGQLYDKKLLSDFCKRNNMYFIVDAISSFLADEYNMSKYGIDLTIISSQKGLCCSPGMSLVSFSKKMLDKLYSINQNIISKYFDFKDYLTNITRGQTPYTPPVLVMYEIQDMLNFIENSGGVNLWLNNIQNKAKYFREKIKKIGLEPVSYPLSNMLTPIEFKNINAYDVTQILKDKYNIFVNPCGGELEKKILRVSHIGNTCIEDIDNLLDKLMSIIDDIKRSW